MNKFFTFSYILIGFFLLESLCHQVTDGFALVNIASPFHKPQKDWTLPIDHEKKELLENLFSQTFTYLHCGAQCYVFESEDKEYVLKFFKYHHMRVLPWMQWAPLPGFLKRWKMMKMQKKNREILSNFDSYYLAMLSLSKETGLIYTHLNKTSLWNKKLKIRDKIGNYHFIDLDETDFLIQKRGKLAYTCIDAWMEKKDLEKAKVGIKHLLMLIKARCMKGIADKDPDFKTNFGFFNETKAFQLDTGRFSIDPSKKEIGNYQEELYRVTRSFREWIEMHHPMLLDDFDRIINEEL